MTPAAPAWTEEALAFRHRFREKILRLPPETDDARDLAEVDFYRLALMTARGAEVEEIAACICEASAATAAAILCLAMPGGTVTFGQRCVRAAPVPLSPVFWLKGVACALLARDMEALEVICYPPHIHAAQLPLSRADACWPFLCAGIASLIRKQDDATAFLDDAEAMLRPEHVAIAQPEMVRLQISPLLAVARALAIPGQDFVTALASALQAHQEWFRQEDSEDPFQLVSLELLGLAALAADRGFQFDPSALPAALVAGSFKREIIPVTYDLPPCRTEQPHDAIQLLDLGGFPRSGRKDKLTAEGNTLVARYDLSGRPGLPRARATFILQGGDNAIMPALDAGQRVLVADLYASQVNVPTAPNEILRAQNVLRRAVESLDLVLASIPPGREHIPDEAFWNPQGLAAQEADPGRFHRDRLTVYRDALRRQLSTLLPSDRELDPKESGMAVAAIIREQLRPLLAELARDKTGLVCRTLRPLAADFEKIFQPAVAAAAGEIYNRLWGGQLELPLRAAGQTEMDIFVAPAGMLAEENELSCRFPSGYHGIAHLLRQECIWSVWRYRELGKTSGLTFDGLVWCGDRWVWLPKPYRELRSLVTEPFGTTIVQ
jgi:hypothetical protein